jgi:hypothetical protein
MGDSKFISSPLMRLTPTATTIHKPATTNPIAKQTTMGFFPHFFINGRDAPINATK